MGDVGNPPGVPPAGRFIGGVFGFVFFGIGMTVLISLWAASFDGFGSPPLVFRIFGSFIAIAFVAMGGTICFGSITGRGMGNRSMDELEKDVQPGWENVADDDPSSGAASGGNYACPKCGAPLDDGSDVSPHGDAKCGYCNAWFNIHGK